MSYTIVYGRQFVRTTRGIVPLVLCGCNNVWSTNYSTGKERRSRNWEVYLNDLLELPDDELMRVLRNRYDPDDQECFMYNGKWMTGADVIRFFENGVKSAMSIDEIREQLPRQALDCHLSVWPSDINEGNRTSNRQYVKTTDELEAWIDTVRPIADEEKAKGCAVYFCIRFQREEPLKLGRRLVTSGPVIVKHRFGYLREYSADGCSKSFSPDIANAIVFESVDDARRELCGKVEGLRFIKAENKEKQMRKCFAIRIEGGSNSGMYVKKLNPRSASLSYSPECARLFTTEDEAQEYYESKIKGRFAGVTGCLIVDVKAA